MAGRIWRIEDIDPDNPEERFLPALQCIPLGPGMQRMVLPEPMCRMISKHLTEAGCPPMDPALATKEYLPPVRGINHPLNGAADWVKPGTPAPEPYTVQDPESLTVHEQAAQLERYRHMGYRIEKPQPEPSAARTVDAIDEPPRFDPGTHSVTEVCSYLRELADTDPVERGRVLYAERNGKNRNGILKRFT
ncbi:DUF2744 domain-containing protein [Nocardia sp. BSTN01]|uniref:phage gene 29 protein family protein n=1 Tax=Nocardia sp. BSTN01 TaxID=2783665 RepID=UPI00188F55C3|nr:DUF2744 domain-containing protein [Nocardia sp. BSTN01]MBF5002214.1 DUF2744 domain-containing protein [Nocardia sp. BSTN01]